MSAEESDIFVILSSVKGDFRWQRCSVHLLAVLQDVVESKNNFLVYNPVSVSFNIKVFTADSQSSSNGRIM